MKEDKDESEQGVAAIRRMEVALRRRFAPEALRLIDRSALHRGHAGARPGGGTHVAVEIVSAAFAGMSRLERSRAVHDALAEAFDDRLHAVTIKASAPPLASSLTSSPPPDDAQAPPSAPTGAKG